MNKFTSISIFICGVAIFAFSVALMNGVFDVPRMQTHIDIPVIPVDAPVNIETDGEMEIIMVPEIKIYGTPSASITGAGAARRRATAVDTKHSESAKGEMRFSTEAQRNYRPSLGGHSVRGVTLEFDRTKVGVPAYRPERDDTPIVIEIQ